MLRWCFNLLSYFVYGFRTPDQVVPKEENMIKKYRILTIETTELVLLLIVCIELIYRTLEKAFI